MWGITKNTWDYYQTYGLVPGMAQPMGKKTINKNNIYKFNHRKAMIPVSMMDAYGIHPNGTFAPGGLANENRRRTKKYLRNNGSRSQSPSPSPSHVSMNSNFNYNSPKSIMNENTKVNEPVWNPNIENEEIKEEKKEGKIIRLGRVLKPLSPMNYQRSNRKSRRARKSRKARTRKA